MRSGALSDLYASIISAAQILLRSSLDSIISSTSPSSQATSADANFSALFMKYIKRNTNQNNEYVDNVFWVTMSDLLLGLVVVFLVLFVFAITGFTQNKISEKTTQFEVIENISKELEKNNIKTDIDKFSGVIKISDLELFEINSWKLSPKGEQFMAKFVPIYFNAIMTDPKIAEKISHIIIEGHTDSQTFANAKTPQEQYFKNMDLSLKRASSVAEYIVYSQYKDKQKYEKELFKLLSVEGKGSSMPILDNGKENFNKSRRVELKISFKDKNLIDAIKK